MKYSILDEHRSARLTHHDSSLQLQIMQQFQSCRHSNRFIDLEVEVEGVVFPCHQILLDAFCPYFAAYFSFQERSRGGEDKKGSDCENGVERVSLKYNGVTVNGFSKLLEFMYTGQLEVTADDVIDVLRGADFLQFHQVVHLCSTFLQQHITTETCLQVLVLARAHDLYDLAQRALSFVLTNLTEAMRHPEFPQLSQEMLENIVSNDQLEIETEATVVEAVMIWAKANKKQRMHALPELLRHARICSINVEHLEKTLLSTKPEDSGQDLFGDAVNFTQSSALQNLTASSVSDRLAEVLVVVCRETQRKHRGVVRDLSTLYFCDPVTLRWEVLTQLPFEDRQDYSAMVVNNILYLTGGQSMNIHDIYCTKIVFNENWAYDPVLDKWEERQSMMIPRYNHSAATMQEKLYVVGGRASSSSHSLRGDGEVYDPTTNQWTFISPLRCIDGIGNAALASLDGKLYLCGGTYYTPSRRSHIPYENFLGAQVYNSTDDLWHELLSLEREITQRKIRMSGGNMITLDGFLLLLDDDIGKSLQLYNPVSQTLTSLIQAHGHHWFAGWAVYQGRLVCTGGLEDGRSGMTDMVHACDLRKGRHDWVMMPPLPCPMSHHACLNMHLSLPRHGAEEGSSGSTPN